MRPNALTVTVALFSMFCAQSVRAGSASSKTTVRLNPDTAEERETLSIAGFGRVTIYAPESPPSQVILFISGDGGWNLGVIPMAERLRDLGALVVGVDIRALLKTIEASGGCAYPGGALDELSRIVQRRRELPEYKAPILVGYSSGATLVYAALAAAPPERSPARLAWDSVRTWKSIVQSARWVASQPRGGPRGSVTTWHLIEHFNCRGWYCRAKSIRCAPPR
jgi:type IV secretory pathway VirJ component